MVFCRSIKIALLVALVPPAGLPTSSLPPVQQASQLDKLAPRTQVLPSWVQMQVVSSVGCRWVAPLLHQTTALMGGTTSIQQQASASPFQSQKQQPSSHISQQPPTSSMANQTGLATPLIPTQQGNVSTGRGWSTSIQGQLKVPKV